jgi:hypothetical protein
MEVAEVVPGAETIDRVAPSGRECHGLWATALRVPAGGQGTYRLKVATTVRASDLFWGLTRRWLARIWSNNPLRPLKILV